MPSAVVGRNNEAYANPWSATQDSLVPRHKKCCTFWRRHFCFWALKRWPSAQLHRPRMMLTSRNISKATGPTLHFSHPSRPRSMFDRYQIAVSGKFEVSISHVLCHVSFGVICHVSTIPSLTSEHSVTSFRVGQVRERLQVLLQSDLYSQQ